MNFNFYIFGNPNGNYDQYPNDYSREIFSEFSQDVVGTRYMILRHGDLMHYAMVSQISDERYIGLCVIVNKAWLRYSKSFFKFLKTVVDRYAFGNDRFLISDHDGNIRYRVPTFSDQLETYAYFKSIVTSAFDGKNKYGVEGIASGYNGDTQTKYVDFDEPNSFINELAEKFNRLIIEDREAYIKDKSSDVSESSRFFVDDDVNAQGPMPSPTQKEDKGGTRKRNRWIILILLILLGVSACRWYDSSKKLGEARDEIDAFKLDSVMSAPPVVAGEIYLMIADCSYSESDKSISFTCYTNTSETRNNFEIKVLEYNEYGTYSYSEELYRPSIYISSEEKRYMYYISPIFSYDGNNPIVEIWMDGKLVGGGFVDAPTYANKATEAAPAEAAAPAEGAAPATDAAKVAAEACAN